MSDDSAIDPLELERNNQTVFNKIRSMTRDLRNVEERERDIISGKNTPVAEPDSADSK